MRISLPFISAEVPDAWSDETVYKFVSPRDTDLSAPLSAARGGDIVMTRATMGFARIKLDAGENAETVLHLQLRTFRSTLPNFRIVSEQPWQHSKLGAHPALEISYDVGAGSLIRQSLVYVQLNTEELLCLTFSASLQAYDTHLASFRRIYESLQKA